MAEEMLKTPAGKEARNWAMAAHLGALAGLVAHVILAHVLVPLIIWLIKKDEDPFIEDQARESLNFQISITLYLIVPVLLCFVVIGFPLVAVIVVFWIIETIVAAVKAGEGYRFRYPFTIRFVK